MNRSNQLLSRIALAALVALGALLAVVSAHAHEVGLSRGEYSIASAVVTARLTFARRDVISLVAGLDADHDGVLTQAEIDQGKDSIDGALAGRVKVRGDNVPCPGALAEAKLAEEDGVSIVARYTCPAPPRSVSIELTLLEDLAFGHRHLARFDGPTGPSDVVLYQKNRSFTFEPSASASAAPPAPAYKGKLSFFPMGIEHILTGYDHLVFLLGLVIIGGRFRSLIGVVTAFTIAHSITLALAALGVWAPSPRIVEPAIALSIAYVGVENFFVKNAEKRWRITFPFGLIHGFGFAGALAEVHMPKADVPWALVLFNVGVESGQLAVLAVVLPIIYVARKSTWARERGVLLVSAGITVAGLIWFVTRAFGA